MSKVIERKCIMGESILELIFLVAYLAWAIYAGNRILTGRSRWLDGDAVVAKICKFFLSFLLGSAVGAIYIWIFLWKTIIKHF